MSHQYAELPTTILRTLIHCLKAFQTQEALVTVVHAFVTSRIDYCNSLLYGISDYNINRLQRIKKSVARIVTNTRKYDHITPILKKIHWLPIRQRIHFRILLITYKSINNMAPKYCVNWCPLESHPETSDHLVRYYCRCQCLGTIHMVIVHQCCSLHLAEYVASKYQKCVVS